MTSLGLNVNAGISIFASFIASSKSLGSTGTSADCPSTTLKSPSLVKNNDLIFIGDSIEDFKVAKKSQIMFILKNNSENKAFRQKNKKINKINSFKKFDKVISNILCRK